LDINIDGADGHFIGDGVIFSTPLGSTAYALAAGGPIVDIALQNVFLAVPSNPHISYLYTSLQRSHVIDGKRTVRVTIQPEDIKNHPVRMVIDGTVVQEHIDKPVNISLSDKRIDLLRLAGNGFYHLLEQKRVGRV
jgi:NAD+ kinase